MAGPKISLPAGMGRAPSRRPARVADAIRREVAGLLLSGVKDPRLALVTVTNVQVTRDLRRAVVYYSCSAEDAGEVAAGLASATGFLRSALAHELAMRYIPELVFERDLSLDQMARIEQLLNEDPGAGEDNG